MFGDDFLDGLDAYARKDYETTTRLWSPLAEQGYHEAQMGMSTMYTLRKGVPQNHKEAFKWYRLSAEQGYASAQLAVGVSYSEGHGALQDYVLAHMWLNLSSSNGNKHISCLTT